MTGQPLEPLELSPAVAKLVENLREARKNLQLWKDHEDYVKGLLIDALHDDDGNHAEIATIDGEPVLRYKVVTQSRLDTSRLKKSLPDVYESFLTMKSYPRMELLT